jgi:Fe2+ or Zn2+ uptake regulation protein
MPASSSVTIFARAAPATSRCPSHHDHLINLRDGKVIEFTSEEIEKLQTEIARKLGYKLVDHRLELYCVPLDENTGTTTRLEHVLPLRPRHL